MDSILLHPELLLHYGAEAGLWLIAGGLEVEVMDEIVHYLTTV